MNDISSLAQQAISLLAPAISLAASTAASHLAEGFLSEPGAKLFDWLAAKLKGTPAAVTLERATAEPHNPRRLEALRLEIEDLAERDPTFREELVTAMKDARSVISETTSTQSSSQVGEGNKSAQAIGENISIQLK
jgi:hypothetical protein